MSKRNHLLLGAAVSVVSSFALAQPVLAQQAAPPKDAVIETPEAAPKSDEGEVIVVTGSRIRRDPSSQTIAITEIGKEEIETRGYVNAIEGLEQLPFVGVGVNNRGASTQFGDANAFVNLLQFGTQRSLTLVDGHRFVTSNQGTVFVPGNNTGVQVDTTIINPALIKRADVLLAGSASTYGADAVAGVTNIILDRDYTGKSFLVQGGLSDRGDGGTYRLSATWGKEILGGKGHIVFGAEYLNSDELVARRNGRLNGVNNIRTINNPANTGNLDGINNTIFQSLQFSNQIPTSGLLALRQVNGGFPAAVAGNASGGSVAQFLFPTNVGNSANDGRFNQFVTATGLTPYQYAIANPTLNGINPLLFVGTFGIPSLYPSVPNTDAATLALGLTRLAVPLTFDSSGNPVAYNLGSIIPPNVADQANSIGSAGFAFDPFTSVQTAQERASYNNFFKYEFTPHFRYQGDMLFSQIQNSNTSDNQGTQTPGCAISSGNCGVPIFFNQNPFVTAATRAQLNAITAANTGQNAVFNFATIGGQPYFALTRSLDDITGGFNNRERNRSRTYETSHSLSGDFQVGERNFDWNGTFAFGRNTSLNQSSNDILDIEFALATDVVTGTNGQPVCRQQTLAAPEAVNIRNPQLTNINIATPGGLVPTAAQIAACVPLNLFGVGQASQAAIDYVTSPSFSFNQASQFYGNISFGGDVVKLPAGFVQFNTNFEWRRETLTFTPDDQFRLGTGRQTIGQPSDGSARFFEGGFEFTAPIFGKDFEIPGFKLLELDGTVRVVQRSGSGTPFGIDNGRVDALSTTAPTFTAGGRWSPIKDITFRGTRSRAVRSPSLVESLGAPQTGFSGLAGLFPCNGNNINGGPSSGIRVTNCTAFAQSLGLPLSAFTSLLPPGGTVPAGVGGNPNLTNEVSDNWQVGVVLKPRFLKHLTLQTDYLTLNLQNQISLTFLGTQCFDQPDFPQSIIGGTSACEAITLATESSPGSGVFTIPTTNIITGNPIRPPAIAGSLAPVQANYTIAAAQFSNVNQGALRQSALISTIGYDFDLPTLFNVNLGNVKITGTSYYIRKFESSSSGDFSVDTSTIDGGPGAEKFQTRMDIAHKMGKFTQVFQWFRDSASTANPNTQGIAQLDANPAFFRPSFNTFNYNLGYEFNDHLIGRLIVNNLTDAQLKPQFGLPGDAFGRNFVFTIQARW